MSMLTEVKKVKQIADEPRRRWFTSTSLDLFLWYDKDDNIIQFQICYDKGPNEQALTWHYKHGFSHHAVDDGENRSFSMKSTPILVGNSDYDAKLIAARFAELAGDIEYKTVQFVLSHIQAK
jgi:hypothetical protein